MQAFAAENGVDLSKSYFYADGDEDVALMYLVGNPRPTNPAGKLAAVAAKRGWPVLRFTSRSGSSPVSQLRTAAGMASMVPIAAGARRARSADPQPAHRRQLLHLGVRAGAADRHRGQPQRARQGEPDRAAARGVHLQPPQPGRPVIAGRLVETNFTSVGKKELENDPIVGTMGKVMDAAFIDRDDPKAAVEGLKKIEELATKGLSILIAPEGTRLDTTEVGPFKKGPFRIAMSAGIPIVPIVIRNAEVIAARDSSTFNPGTVDVVVYPPIPVDDWTAREPARTIAEVRQLYLDTLKDWPHEELPRSADLVRSAQEGAGEEGRQEGAPAKKATAKKTRTAKKAARQEGAGQDDAPRRPPAKKAPAKKTAAKKAAAKGRP